LLERALAASGDDLDSAIQSLKELNLESTQAVLSATASENGQPTAVQPSVEGSFSTKTIAFLGYNKVIETIHILPHAFVQGAIHAKQCSNIIFE
jgi:hypothetical protein